jgi:hypothetical protein
MRHRHNEPKTTQSHGPKPTKAHIPKKAHTPKPAKLNNHLYAKLLVVAVALHLIHFFFLNHPSKSPPSLVDTYSLSHLPSCSANRISLNSAVPPIDQSKPTIYTDWKIDSPNLSDRTRFQHTYGQFAQYVKDGDALPLVNREKAQCTATFKTLVDTMSARFLSKSNVKASRATEDDILIFTNNDEAPQFFNAIRKEFSTPPHLARRIADDVPISDAGSTMWPKIFSVMMRASAHRFHQHDEAWLGQVSGSRLWFLIPPSVPRSELGSRPPACDYLSGLQSLPEVQGVMACIQKAGEAMYLPPKWWHGTCGLEEWNVGVGEQRGAPALSEPIVGEMSEEEEREKVERCDSMTRGWNKA